MGNLQLEVQAMKRSVIIAAASALLLSACSGSKEPAPEAKPPEVAAKKGGKGAKEVAHVNPWAKDAPTPAAALAVKDAPAKKGEDAPKVNPWAKDPPPGSVPAEPAPAPKKKKKK
jgi:hypothetical protein